MEKVIYIHKDQQAQEPAPKPWRKRVRCARVFLAVAATAAVTLSPALSPGAAGLTSRG